MVELKTVTSKADNLLRRLIAEKLRFKLPQGCRRVLLVNPVHVPKEDYSVEVAVGNRYPVYPPYGLGVLSRNLRERGYETDLIDLNFDLQEELQSGRQGFNYDVWEEWLRERIENFQPDLVALTCMFTVTHRAMKRTAEFIRENYPYVSIIAGGVHTTQAGEMVLKDCPEIDFIGLYEGNTAFGDLLDFVNGRAGEEALSQIAALIDGEYTVLKNRAAKNRTSVSVRPYYHDLRIGDYSPKNGRIGVYYWLWPEGTRASTVLANVGCRAQCTFCSVRNFNGRGVFDRPASDVVDEIEYIRDTYGVRHIMWLDDDLLYGGPVALFNEMVRRNLGITWDASNGIIASAMTEEIAQAAYESGCIGLSFGVESGSERILRSVKKPSGVRHFHRCMEILRKYPQIFTKFLLIVGFPDETIGEVWQTIKLCVETQPDWSTIQVLNYIPGVEITNHALNTGLLTQQQLIDGTERPFTGSTGQHIRNVAGQKERAKEFVNLLDGDPVYVPQRDEIADIWMVMDWKINYEGKIWREENPIKLEMLRKLFVNICDKTHANNALVNLYFAVLEFKLGRPEEAQRRLALAKTFSESVAYWRLRFAVLGLNEIMRRVEEDIRLRQPAN